MTFCRKRIYNIDHAQLVVCAARMWSGINFVEGPMARFVIDKERLGDPAGGVSRLPAAGELFREGGVFFVGGDLSLDDTLVTMFDSFCMEATSLFFLTLGSRENYPRGIEMARQIKKNFHARLMAGIDQAVDGATIERLYTAGVDNLVIPLRGDYRDTELPSSFASARSIFPRWGVAASVSPAVSGWDGARHLVDLLLQVGVVPLVTLSGLRDRFAPEDAETLLQHLVAVWEKFAIPMPVYLPLVGVMTPLVEAKPAGLLRGIVDRLRDRRQLAESDLRRHLRVLPTEDSLDSAGL